MPKIKIENLEDMKKVSHMILEKVVKGNIAYFSLNVVEENVISSCYFTPVAPIREKEKRQSVAYKLDKRKGGSYFLGASDVEKIIMLLLSNPNCKDLEYDPEENCILGNFFNPYGEELFNMESEVF